MASLLAKCDQCDKIMHADCASKTSGSDLHFPFKSVGTGESMTCENTFCGQNCLSLFKQARKVCWYNDCTRPFWNRLDNEEGPSTYMPCFFCNLKTVHKECGPNFGDHNLSTSFCSRDCADKVGKKRV